jgi:hypothetical protein
MCYIYAYKLKKEDLKELDIKKDINISKKSDSES